MARLRKASRFLYTVVKLDLGGAEDGKHFMHFREWILMRHKRLMKEYKNATKQK